MGRKLGLIRRRLVAVLAAQLTGFVTLDTFMTGGPDRRYGEGNG